MVKVADQTLGGSAFASTVGIAILAQFGFSVSALDVTINSCGKKY